MNLDSYSDYAFVYLHTQSLARLYRGDDIVALNLMDAIN